MRKTSPESGGVLLVGIHPIEAVLKKDPRHLSDVTVVEPVRNKRLQALLALAKNQGVSVRSASADEITDLCGHTKHQGIFARYSGEVDRGESSLLSDLGTRSTPWLILVLDGITDPHNLGACLRSADAAGVDAVIVPRHNAVGMTQVVQKVAAGAAASVRLYTVTNLVRVIRGLQEQGVWVYGATGESQESLFDQCFGDSIALVLGAEGTGLRKSTREACDGLYRIPMTGTVESLNVSVATGISLFEVHRQRSGSTDNASK